MTNLTKILASEGLLTKSSSLPEGSDLGNLTETLGRFGEVTYISSSGNRHIFHVEARGSNSVEIEGAISNGNFKFTMRRTKISEGEFEVSNEPELQREAVHELYMMLRQ